MNVTEDFSDWAKTLASRKEQDAELSQLLPAMATFLPGYLFAFDAQSLELVYASPSVQELLGSESKTGGVPPCSAEAWLPALIHADDHPLFASGQALSASSLPSVAIHFRMRCSSESWQWVHGAFQPMNGLEGALEGPRLSWVIGLALPINDKHLIQYLEDHKRFEQQAQKLDTLTPREKQVLRLIGEQRTSREIAKRLSISKQTVQTHRKNLIKKLQVANSIGLATYARFFPQATPSTE